MVARELFLQDNAGGQLRLRAIVSRSNSEKDISKRASLLRTDSVHGVFTGTVKEDFENSKEKGESLNEWLDRQPDEYFKRIQLSNGGVVDLAKYRKSKEPKIRKLNLSQGDYDRAVIDVQSQSDRDLIKQLLKMSGINVGKGKD